jgi:hypothetical protein
VKCNLWEDRTKLALTKARKCLPPTISKIISARISDDVITGWLGEQRERDLLIEEVLALPDPPKEKS